MRTLLCLFDDCAFSGCEPYLGRQDDPLPGVHNSGAAAPLFAKLGEGGLWHHDLFHGDGRAYDPAEIAPFRAQLARPA